MGIFFNFKFREIDFFEQHQLVFLNITGSCASPKYPEFHRIESLAVILNDLFTIFCKNVENLAKSIENPMSGVF